MMINGWQMKVVSGILCMLLVFGSTPLSALAADEVIPEKPLTMAERVAAVRENRTPGLIVVQNSGVQPGHVYIPKDTTFEVELVKDANSKINKKGQTIEIRMVDNLMINNIVIIAKDTIGEAIITEARKAGGFGRKGKLAISPTKIKTINSITVPLTANFEGQGKSDGGAVAVAAVVSLVGGIFMKGSNINYSAGTNIKVATASDVDLMATSENLAEVMNPAKLQGNNLLLMVK